YTWAQIHARTHTHKRILGPRYTPAHTHTSVYLGPDTRPHTHTQAYTWAQIHARTHTHSLSHIFSLPNIQTQTHTYTHMNYMLTGSDDLHVRTCVCVCVCAYMCACGSPYTSVYQMLHNRFCSWSMYVFMFVCA